MIFELVFFSLALGDISGDDNDVKIFIGNLDKDKVTNNDLENAFSKYGDVSEAVVVDKYGFVHMSNRDDAKIAIGRLHKTSLNGCLVDVCMSTGENRRGGGDSRGGGGRGGGGRDFSGGRRGSDRRDDRGGGGRRDPYYDDYYGPPRGGYDYGRRPPPPDPYYRDRYDSRDDGYGRRPPPPPPPRGRDPYYNDPYYGPPRGGDSYGYPPARDSYADYGPSYDRGAPPPRRDEGGPRGSRYPPPPMGRETAPDPYPPRRDEYAAPPRSDYGAAPRSDYPDTYARGRQIPQHENFAEDSYGSSRAGGSGGLYNTLSSGMAPSGLSEYPGEKRPVASESYGYSSGGPPPAKRSAYGTADLGSYGY